MVSPTRLSDRLSVVICDEKVPRGGHFSGEDPRKFFCATFEIVPASVIRTCAAAKVLLELLEGDPPRALVDARLVHDVPHAAVEDVVLVKVSETTRLHERRLRALLEGQAESVENHRHGCDTAVHIRDLRGKVQAEPPFEEPVNKGSIVNDASLLPHKAWYE